MSTSIKVLVAASAAMMLGGMVVTATPAAAAAGRDGVCDNGEFCYYFNSGNQGSVSDFTGSVANYATTQPSCYDFKGPGTGKGECIKNSAASVWNRSNQTVRVFYNSGHAGRHQDFAPGAKANLEPGLKNQNASHRFQGSGTPTGCKTDGTDTRMPTTILVYMRAQNRVVRVGFKDYVKNVLPNEWLSNWRPESLKAGAVAVKNFGWYWALRSNSKTPGGQCYDVQDSTMSQVYRPGSAKASTSAAVDATWGTRLTRAGKIFKAQYCRTHTECGHWSDGDWMSQIGSRDLANAGWDHRRILQRYYRGVVLH
ncbi:SpoIID/LytB domain-containing protein [Nonomuraea longicatena]|uniref:Sporulation stage II protein D amidase enhancer LytB N-terminal domain-containing protein n=1 Tax=Nonomuraea longicatena TaxID=83682 RepID=A0ABP4AH95_9ACTN